MVWMMMFRNGFFGNSGSESTADNFNSRQIAALQDTVNSNHNNDLAMQAIQGNGDAIHELAGNLNVGVTALNSAIDDVQAGIARVASNVGLSGERVINAIGQGNLNLIQQLKDCCCTTQKEILKMGYDNQIATLNQTNDLQARLTNIGNGIAQGFASTAYETQKQTAEIVNAGNANTQRILDTLNGHWVAETSQALQDAKFEISQLKQTQYLASQINGGTSNGSIW